MSYPTTIKGIQAGLKAGDFTAVELLEGIYERIAAVDGDVKAFLALNKEEALVEAKAADERGYGDDAPKLNGVPVGVKDNILTKGLTTTASSKMLENFVPTYDATVVRKLREAGAIIVGKLNMDEFAMGASSETSYFQTTHNPWDLNRVPGGSSSGSGAAVGSRQVPATLGSDTGGSIRNPAAFNGVVGMKPTYGAVSRLGAIAMASSLDQIGPLTITVEDNALLLEVLAGHDPMDSTSFTDDDLDTNYSAKLGQSLAGLKIAYPVEYKSDVIDPEIRAAIDQAAQYFEAQGAIVEEVSLPNTEHGVNAYYVIMAAESSVNLQRFDGIRYGYRSPNAKDLDDIYVMSRSEGFGDEVKRRIMLGTYSLSSESYDLYYKKAAQVRTLIREDFEKVLADYDLIMGPTTTTVAFEIGERSEDPIEMYMADLLTVPANLAGNPAMSVPAGLNSEGMPIGMQLIGRSLDEATLYQVADNFEKGHDFVDQAPNL